MQYAFLATALVTVFAAQDNGLHSLLAKASEYVAGYEKAFSLLVSEERYTQTIERPLNAGSNLSRTNPGGGMIGGNVVRQQIIRSDYLLVQLGEGGGWMPFRDVFQVNDKVVRDREDRLAKLFLQDRESGFELGDRIMAESTRHNLGNVTRTINIPTLGMMFLHPRVRDRFAFKGDGTEMMSGREVRRVRFRETARPTLIKTTRGRDLILEGTMWIDERSGAIVKTSMVAADPAVRATVEVTFREDPELEIWVPAQMDEYYKATNALDEIFATAVYTNVRKFQVSTNETIGKPPGMEQGSGIGDRGSVQH
jgi:hypothetical protein